MPYRPPTVSDDYGSRWQRLRAQSLRSEPLCRLCLSVGLTVPATVVDHITPLKDGGKNETENFQSLCKRCHDSIKTPDDFDRRKRAERSELSIRAVWLGSECGVGIDFRLLRRHIALTAGIDRAHPIMLAAMDGVLASGIRGELPPCNLTLVCDDSRWCKIASARYKSPCVIDNGRDVIEGVAGTVSEQRWLRERLGLEYAFRHDKETKGSQQPRSG